MLPDRHSVSLAHMDVRGGTETEAEPGTGGGLMPPTLWSLVAQGGAGSVEALDKLCRMYWKPIHAYLCRWGVNPTDADDVTQQFLLRLQQRDRLARPRAERGRFRSYLLTALRNFLHDYREREGAREFVPVAGPDGPQEGAVELPAAALSPDQEFERNGTLALIQQALDELRADYAARGQAERFELLSQLLPGKHAELSQAEIGERLGLSEGAVAKAVFDLRQRFRNAFRRVVGMTVHSYDEVDQEIADHLAILSR